MSERRDAVRRRAKIVCPLGLATSSAAAIGELIDAGMDVARRCRRHLQPQ